MAPSHPPYIDMITEALISLKERTGSSHYAIAKHIEEQQKVRDLPPNFKKLLFVQLKKFVASGKLVKVKNSFKLPGKKSSAPESKPKQRLNSKEGAEKKDKEAAKKGKFVKVKSPVKAKKPKSIKSPAKKAAATKKAKK